MIFVSPVMVCPFSTFKPFKSLSSSVSLVSESKLFRWILIRIVFKSFFSAKFSTTSLLEARSTFSTLSESLAPDANCVPFPEKISGIDSLVRETEYADSK